MIHLVAAQKWIPKLVDALRVVRKQRSTILIQIGDTFGDPLRLARFYIQPLCQQNNPATENIDIDSIVRDNTFHSLNEFFARCNTEVHSDGRRQMFVLADAGVGKTSLLVMLKLAHLCSFWPREYKCELFKLGTDTIAEIAKLKDHAHTVLLLDSIDEDPVAFGRIGARISDLLALTRNFHAVVITCRTQYFPIAEPDPLERMGSVRVGGYQCPIIYLTPFTEDQVKEYLRKRFPRSFWQWTRRVDNPRYAAALRVLKKTTTLQLRPMLLAHIDDLVRKDSERELNSYEAFDILVQEWLEREVRRGKVTSRESLDVACVAVARRLDTLGQRALSRKELAEVYSEEPRAKTIELIDVGGRALLNMTSSGAFRFAHFALQEFVLAREIVQRSTSSPMQGFDHCQLVSVRGTTELLRFVQEGVLSRSRPQPMPDRDGQPSEACDQNPIVGRVEFRDVNLAMTHMNHLRFTECSFPRASFTRADLSGSSFTRCDLRQADLSHSTLMNVQLNGADLSGANLNGANLNGANLNGAKLKGAHLKGAHLKGVSLAEVDLEKVDFAEVNLAEVDFGRVNFDGANFTGADLKAAGYLKGASLKAVNLKGANLQGANLQGANLQGANLQDANLQDANLEGASLQMAYLVRADLRHANLLAAKLIKADLTDAHMAGANLSAAVLDEATLERANLRAAYLVRAELRHANLLAATLVKADLTGAHLEGTNLSATNLDQAKLSAAKLFNADLTGAHLESTDLEGAIYNEDTRWPDGLLRRKP